jgi:predicted phage terminase large subunit-like protein
MLSPQGAVGSRPDAILVEEKANGAAVISDLQDEIPGIVPFIPDRHGNKYARAQLATPGWQAGNYWLPDASVPGCEWVSDFVRYLCGFPLADHDDDVDAMSQLHLWWRDAELSGDSEAFAADYEEWIRRQGG